LIILKPRLVSSLNENLSQYLSDCLLIQNRLYYFG